MVHSEMPRKNPTDRFGEFRVRACHNASRFKQLELQRFQEALRAFEDLERFEPELARLATEVLKGRGNAASWFAAILESSDIVSPWQCIAEGKVAWVQKALASVTDR